MKKIFFKTIPSKNYTCSCAQKSYAQYCASAYPFGQDVQLKMNSGNSLSAQIFAAFGDVSLYAILNVSAAATSEEIKKGYRKMALKHHPDKGGQ